MGHVTTARSQLRHADGPVTHLPAARSDEPAIDLRALADHVDPLVADITQQIRRLRTIGWHQQDTALTDLRRAVYELGQSVDQAAGGWPPAAAPDEAP
ncbi:hypothetical protein ACQP2P_15790 [Dactylosporangium sp. CA-139114]|uniref:hypothetical protein n=1 Tax=Dactylosporangium sp. CA-139114 TaxID=3239931 RepID=UPI003D973E05